MQNVLPSFNACDYPLHECAETTTLTEATLTEGQLNGEWITYNTPCTTTPVVAGWGVACEEVCCEIPFGVTGPMP